MPVCRLFSAPHRIAHRSAHRSAFRVARAPPPPPTMSQRYVTVTFGLRGLAAAVVAGAFAISWLNKRFSPASATKRRILRLLDRMAPKVALTRAGPLLNDECPVCLCPLEGCVRALECRHALCSRCLETWVLHAARAHLDPTRFSYADHGGAIAPPAPSCPLCKMPLGCVPELDFRNALLAAMLARGTAFATYDMLPPPNR